MFQRTLACLGEYDTDNPCEQYRVMHTGDTVANAVIVVELLSRKEICDPRAAVARTSMARCGELALLRLQDIWLAKFITSGIACPALEILRGTKVTSAQLVGRLTVILAFAIITCGHLPLMMLMLLLVMFSHALTVAVTFRCMNLDIESRRHGIAMPSIVAAKISSAIVKLVIFSEDRSAMCLASAFMFIHAASDMATVGSGN